VSLRPTAPVAPTMRAVRLAMHGLPARLRSAIAEISQRPIRRRRLPAERAGLPPSHAARCGALQRNGEARCQPLRSVAAGATGRRSCSASSSSWPATRRSRTGCAMPGSRTCAFTAQEPSAPPRRCGPRTMRARCFPLKSARSSRWPCSSRCSRSPQVAMAATMLHRAGAHGLEPRLRERLRARAMR
jgi:hypothetical protein